MIVCLREGKPLKPKTLLFNIRVQQNQPHDHQITSLIVESPFHCFWGKRKHNFVCLKNYLIKWKEFLLVRKKVLWKQQQFTTLYFTGRLMWLTMKFINNHFDSLVMGINVMCLMYIILHIDVIFRAKVVLVNPQTTQLTV